MPFPALEREAYAPITVTEESSTPPSSFAASKDKAVKREACNYLYNSYILQASLGMSRSLGIGQSGLELRASALKAMQIFCDDLVMGEVPHDHVIAVFQSKLCHASNTTWQSQWHACGAVRGRRSTPRRRSSRHDDSEKGSKSQVKDRCSRCLLGSLTACIRR